MKIASPYLIILSTRELLRPAEISGDSEGAAG
jgi:hypothetical protein